MLVVTQILAMFQSAALAASALTGTMTVWHLMLLGTVQALINAFDMPARQSFLRQMVDDPADLPNAIALNSSLVNLTRLLGPMVGALLIEAVGVGGCFAVDALSYLAVIASLLAMRLPPGQVRAAAGPVGAQLREGLAYAWRDRTLRALLLFLAAMSVCGAGYQALLPAIAEGTLHGGPRTLGWLMGSAGAGAVVGALALARREGAAGLERVVAGCGFGIGFGLVGLEAARGVVVVCGLMFVVGLSLIVHWAATNTLVQGRVEPEKLGRMMSLLAVAFFGGAPVGALLLGTLATLVGPVHALAVAGVGCVGSAAAFARGVRTAGR